MRPYLTMLAACFLSSNAGAGDILNVGDPAPPLAVSGWVKGDKVGGFEPGKVYVVEFWATWCGPCIAGFPHLNGLAKAYRDEGVRFIAVDVWESNPDRVRPFVEEMGDKMDFGVAMDDVPEPGAGAMAKTWLAAAEEHAIPVAFIIRDGKIAWIGHPTLMDDPLAKIAAGAWEPEAMARERLAAKTKERRVSLARAKILAPYDEGDYKSTVAAIEQAAVDEPELAEEYAPLKFAALCHGGDVEAGLALGARLFEASKDDAGALMYIASFVVHLELKDAPDPRVARFALKAARRAVELTEGKQMQHLDTLAQALFRAGDPIGAVAAEEKVLKLLDEKRGPSPSYLEAQGHKSASERHNAHLGRYRDAAEK